MLAGLPYRAGLSRRDDLKRNRHGPVLVPRANGVPGRLKDGQHRGVLRQHIRDEPLHPKLQADRGQVLQQQRTNPLAVMAVRNVERHLRGRVVEPLQAGVADRLVAHGHHQQQVVPIVHDRRAFHQLVRGGLHRGEEAQVDRLGDCSAWNLRIPSASSGTIGRRCATEPSRNTTSASQPTRYPGGRNRSRAMAESFHLPYSPERLNLFYDLAIDAAA